MCLETMDNNTKYMKTDCLRKSMKPGSKMRWRQLHISTEEALKPCPPGAMKGNPTKCHRREQRRAHFAKLSKYLGVMGKKEKMEAVFKGRPAAACVERPQAGAMAPRNTTQYLMSNVYEDMEASGHTAPVQQETSAHLYVESLSPSSVYSALDSGYESCLAFQQRNFEEVLSLCW